MDGSSSGGLEDANDDVIDRTVTVASEDWSSDNVVDASQS